MKKATTKLQRSVIRALGGRDDLEDVANHGANMGFPGFTYHKETVGFFKRHKADIIKSLEESADDFGEPVLKMVASFRCMEGYSELEIAKVLYGRADESSEYTQIANCLAWYALETVAHELTD